MNSFAALAVGVLPLEIVLAVAFAPCTSDIGCSRASSLSANVLAWTSALVVWWIGLLYARGIYLGSETVRYLYVGAVFIVLAAIPPRPLTLPKPARTLQAAVAVVLLIGVVMLVNRPGIDKQADAVQGRGPRSRDPGDHCEPVPTVGPRHVLVPGLRHRPQWQAVPGAHRPVGLPAEDATAEHRRPARRVGNRPSRTGRHAGRAVHTAGISPLRRRGKRRHGCDCTPLRIVRPTSCSSDSVPWRLRSESSGRTRPRSWNSRHSSPISRGGSVRPAPASRRSDRRGSPR